LLARDYIKQDFTKPEAFAILNNMRKICNHPFMFFSYMESEKGMSSKFNAELMKHRCSTEYTQYAIARDQAGMGDRKQKEALISSQNWKMSGKIKVLMSFLKEWKEEDPTTKVLIFS
jgi:SNF2 family DNA or RNA helicase